MDQQDAYAQWYQAGLAKACYDCANRPGFVEHFNRLTGCHFGPDSRPDDDDSQQFAAFVDQYIWSYTVKEMDHAIEQTESNEER